MDLLQLVAHRPDADLEDEPDGSEQQQITGDAFNNWFPHIAPDGKSMVVISFLADIDPADHPFYKHVYLRHMDLEGPARA